MHYMMRWLIDAETGRTDVRCLCGRGGMFHSERDAHRWFVGHDSPQPSVSLASTCRGDR